MIESQVVDRRAFHAGDPAAFRLAVESYSPRLLPLLLSFTHDRDDAHDLLQEVWRLAYSKRRTFSGRGTLLGWLISIARNVAINSRRLRQSHDRFAPEGELHMSTGTPTPSEALEQGELARAIRKALFDLPDREREVVILRMLEQQSTREAAAILGCAEGTVKASLHSALKKLRTPMEVWTG